MLVGGRLDRDLGAIVALEPVLVAGYFFQSMLQPDDKTLGRLFAQPRMESLLGRKETSQLVGKGQPPVVDRVRERLLFIGQRFEIIGVDRWGGRVATRGGNQE